MTQYVYDDAFVSIGGVDLSAHVESAALTYEAEQVDDTVMGDETRQFLGGLKNWSMDIQFKQDFAAAQVDATLFAMVGTPQTCIIRGDNTAGVGAANPNYSGLGMIAGYNPFGGTVGDSAVAPVSVVPAGDLSRLTS